MLKNNTIKVFLVLGIILFLTGFGYLGVDYYNKEYQAEIYQEKIEALNTEVLNLERDVLELEVLFQDTDLETANKDELLKQGYDRINFLEEKVNTLEREGKLNKAQIAELRNKLMEAKANVMMYDKYQKELEFVYADNRRLKGILDSISNSEDEKYAEIIDQYKAQMESLRQEKNSLETSLEGAKEIVNAVESLKAENFRFYSVKNGKEEQNIRFKAGNLKNFKIKIDLIENALAQTGVYDLYMAIRAPDATIMTNKPKGYGGSIRFDEKSILYSRHSSVYYDRRRNSFSFDFIPSDSEPYIKGDYRVVIYCKGERIGEGTFSVY
ncbi:MAG: hypothetical protein AAF824_02510 [Bacteroidota bacterium]